MRPPVKEERDGECWKLTFEGGHVQFQHSMACTGRHVETMKARVVVVPAHKNVLGQDVPDEYGVRDVQIQRRDRG